MGGGPMPLLADEVANEANVPLGQVMLLRHSNTKTRLLERYGASIEEYTLSQPTSYQV